MTREVAHYKMFASALETIQPNFPPGVLQGDPRYTHTYFNLSNGGDIRGAWNQGSGDLDQGEWVYISNPEEYVDRTKGLTDVPVEGSTETIESAEAMGRQLGKKRSAEVKSGVESNPNEWSSFPKSFSMPPASFPNQEDRVNSK
jgi:Mn-containing catalase